ncbi:hypothetical protein N8I77_009207 [Diaporthe amygdali]|uniref:Methyltransferase domain-containing protein n=1 Tax=Phomopsis amygdali TaxID=1214568 RepID=A0AAD9S9B2_PHOAM|nr:hypothetical protein N8I77_009207 [Diaporthe amygdali]
MAHSGTPPPQAVHHELRTAENSAGYLLPTLAELHKANPRLRLLDVGAGSGTISATLAKAIQPDGHVIATDIEADILPRAKAVADLAGITNIDYQEADVLSRLPFEDSTFDVTHCHQVLAHLPRPADAIREMLRVTKPGGIVAAREGDLETECVWPDLPGLAKFHTLAAAVISMAGGSPKAGRQLLSWALQAGVSRDQVTPGLGSWCYSEPQERKVWAQGMVDALQKGRLRSIGLSSKLATEDDLQEMVAAWEEWASADGAILGMMQGEILVRKV